MQRSFRGCGFSTKGRSLSSMDAAERRRGSSRSLEPSRIRISSRAKGPGSSPARFPNQVFREDGGEPSRRPIMLPVRVAQDFPSGGDFSAANLPSTVRMAASMSERASSLHNGHRLQVERKEKDRQRRTSCRGPWSSTSVFFHCSRKHGREFLICEIINKTFSQYSGVKITMIDFSKRIFSGGVLRKGYEEEREPAERACERTVFTPEFERP